jgi:pyruvate kinase
VKVKKGAKPVVELSFRESCVIKPNKGVNVPGKKLKIPSLSEKDKESIKFAVKHNLSFIAVSFTRYKEDVLGVKKLIGDSPIGLIAKIENEEGIQNIREIIEVSDGIMVARGDLGVEIPAQKIPYLQKMMVQRCNTAGKIVIVATQMLESMTNSPVPTRAEVSDVANAVLDGADAVMLSGETASGKYPVKAIEVMHVIATEIEDKIKHHVKESMGAGISERISTIASSLAEEAKATKIVCITRSGFSAHLIARYRPHIPIIAITNSEETLLKLKLVWGIIPVIIKPIPVNSIMATLAHHLTEKNILSKHDLVVFIGGVRTVQSNVLNMVEIHKVDDILKYREKYIHHFHHH